MSFDPENGHRTEIGSSLQEWASWLLADPDVHGARGFATAWQDQFGPLSPDQRLIPWRFFVLGGDYDPSNLTVKDAADCMRIRGPLAQHVHDLPRGGTVQLGGEQRPTHADLHIVADYGQIHLYDRADATIDVSEQWSEHLINLRIGADPDEPGLIGLGTARSATLPVRLELLADVPDAGVQGWDHVVEASIEAPSGVLVLNGPTASQNNAVDIHLAPGSYRVRHHIAGEDTVSDDALDGQDHYQLLLWPDPYQEPHVVTT